LATYSQLKEKGCQEDMRGFCGVDDRELSMWVETCWKAYQVVVMPSSSSYIHSIDQQSNPCVHESLTLSGYKKHDFYCSSAMEKSDE